MKKLIYLLMAVCAVGAVQIDLNNQTDSVLECINESFRKRAAFYNYDGGVLNEHVDLNWFNLLGMDSLQRTGNCSSLKENGTTTYEYHFGWRMLVLTFPALTIDNQRMSAFLRISNNSFHLKIVMNESPCNATVEVMEMEDLSEIEFDASLPEYKGMDGICACKRHLLPAINNKLLSIKLIIQMQLSNMLCQENVTHEDAFSQLFMNL